MSSISHLAIIMDGNGRWAQARNYPRHFGHIRGSRNVKKILKACTKRNISYLTLYAFSTENWNRPAQEISLLMKLLSRFLKRERQELMQENVRFQTIGDITLLPEEAILEVQNTVEMTANNSGIVLTLALNYGGRNEILKAAQELAAQAVSGQILVQNISTAEVEKHLYTSGMPDPDLVIRTSGEFRISNFLLWQSAYSEYYVTNITWPDFSEAELDKALENYSQRERRFGKTGQQVRELN